MSQFSWSSFLILPAFLQLIFQSLVLFYHPKAEGTKKMELQTSNPPQMNPHPKWSSREKPQCLGLFSNPTTSLDVLVDKSSHMYTWNCPEMNRRNLKEGGKRLPWDHASFLGIFHWNMQQFYWKCGRWNGYVIFAFPEGSFLAVWDCILNLTCPVC